jgi:CRP/FNR family cyclic AMP-dependent transcriptional regulator
MQRKSFQPQDLIFSEGDPSDLAYLIVRGHVDICIGDGDNRRCVATLKAGDVFGEMGLIEAGPRSATAISRGRTVCAAYDADQLLAGLETDPQEAMIVIKSLIGRLREANQRILAAEGRPETLGRS